MIFSGALAIKSSIMPEDWTMETQRKVFISPKSVRVKGGGRESPMERSFDYIFKHMNNDGP